MKSGGNWKTRTNDNLREIKSERRANSFDGLSARGIGLKDVGVDPLAGTVVVDLGALGSGLGSGRQRPMRRRKVRDVGTSSQTAAPAPGTRKVKKTRAGGWGGPPVSCCG